MTKVVQTTLDEQEYRTLREVLRRRGLSLKEGLRIAVTKLVLEEMKLDPSDHSFQASQPEEAATKTSPRLMTDTYTGVASAEAIS